MPLHFKYTEAILSPNLTDLSRLQFIQVPGSPDLAILCLQQGQNQSFYPCACTGAITEQELALTWSTPYKAVLSLVQEVL